MRTTKGGSVRALPPFAPRMAAKPRRTRPLATRGPPGLEPDAIPALQVQHRPRFRRRGDLAAERFEHLADLGHLLGVRFRQLALADEQRVLEPDADIAAEQRRLSAELELVAPGGEGREQVVVAEQR